MLRLIRHGTATTRGDLVTTTGLARSTISQRVDALLSQQLLVAEADAASTGGRPAAGAQLQPRAPGIVLAADLGATHARLAVTDLAGTRPRRGGARHRDRRRARGGARLARGAASSGSPARAATPAALLGVGVGLPGPVEYATGVPIAPPIMPGWDGYPVAERLRERFGAPALIDNDANLMALGERRAPGRTPST